MRAYAGNFWRLSAEWTGLNVAPVLSTRMIGLDPDRPDSETLNLAAEIIKQGGLVAFATETVYGLGASAIDPAAVARIFAAKERPAINPLIVHVLDAEQARACVAGWPAAAERLAAAYWPGPLTLVLERSALIPDEVTAGHDTVAIRAPRGKVAAGLIERAGLPIAAPSANRANRISPTRAEHVLADLDGRVDLILDSGPTTIGLESTVVDLTADEPRLLRPGPITRGAIEDVLGRRVLELAVVHAGDRLASPGQMAVHYAPTTRALRVESIEELKGVSERDQIALLVIGEHDSSALSGFTARFEMIAPDQAARQLYDVLHRCDALRLGLIIVVMPPDEPVWKAVRDRLLRATGPLREGV